MDRHYRSDTSPAEIAGFGHAATTLLSEPILAPGVGTPGLGSDVIDANGFRANVGIILLNEKGRVFWGRRSGMDAWQFPQGGIKPEESAERAMYRELREEVGLEPHHVEVLGCTRQWLRYRLPKRFIRYHQKPICIGQKQIWYILRLAAEEGAVDLESSHHPEFADWCWVSYWRPLRDVVFFKRQVYRRALVELAPLRAAGPEGPAGASTAGTFLDP